MELILSCGIPSAYGSSGASCGIFWLMVSPKVDHVVFITGGSNGKTHLPSPCGSRIMIHKDRILQTMIVDEMKIIIYVESSKVFGSRGGSTRIEFFRL